MRSTYKRAIAVLLAALLALIPTACGGSPELQEGESYYEGDIAFEYAESCTVYFVLSADGKTIRDATVVMKDLKIELPYKSATVSKTVRETAGIKTMNFGGGQPDGQGFLELEMRAATLRLSMAEDGVSGEMDYSYMTKPSESPSIEIALGTYPFSMEDRTDSLAVE